MGPFIYISMMKNWVSHILFLRKGGIILIPGSAEKGGYSGRTSVLCHIWVFTPPPPRRVSNNVIHDFDSIGDTKCSESNILKLHTL